MQAKCPRILNNERRKALFALFCDGFDDHVRSGCKLSKRLERLDVRLSHLDAVDVEAWLVIVLEKPNTVQTCL